MATIIGTKNDDSNIEGTDLGDTISGLEGNDVLRGYGGNDILIGGPGDDYMDGGEGTDTYRISKTDGIDFIYNADSGGIDTIEFTDLASTDLADAAAVRRADSSGNVWATADSCLVIGYGTDNALIIGYYFRDDPQYRVDYLQFKGGIVWTWDDIKQKVLISTPDGDILRGYNGESNTISGGAGGDQIFGADQADKLSGGDDGDTINAGEGGDTVNGDAGNDTLYGEGGNDTLRGGAGIDSLDGGDGDDKLYGDAGLDVLTGGTGNDTFIIDIKQGGLTKDLDTIIDFKANSEAGEKIRLTDGGNTLSLVDIGNLLDADIDGYGKATVSGANTTLWFNNGAKLVINNSTANGATTLTKADFDTGPVVEPKPPVNTVPGAQTAFQDTAKVFSGNAFKVADADSTDLTVTLTATHGSLSLSGTTGLSFTSGDGTDDASLSFSGKTAALNTALNGLKFMPESGYTGSDAAIDILTSDGNANDDDTVAITVNEKAPNTPPALSAGSFTLAANSPNGTLVGQMKGSDPDAGDTLAYSIIANNPDNDFDDQPAFAIDSKTGKITVNDSDDLDGSSTAFKLGIQVADTSNATAKAAATITLNGGNDQPGVTVTPDQAASVTTENNSLVTAGNLGGTATFKVVLDSPISADVVITFKSNDETEGKLDNPVLTFTSANWSVPQTLTVRGVDDLLYDGNVSYTVAGTVASDDIHYTRGITLANLALTNNDDPEDKPQTGNGDKTPADLRDQWTGGNGPDTYYAGRDIDYVKGGLGDDLLYGEQDDDKLWGEGGNDTLWGGYGVDQLDGGDGDDKLYGEQDNDTLTGGAGNDLLDGGLGTDKMSGGGGADTYYVDDKGDTVSDLGTDGATDTVLIPVFLSYTLGASIENGKLIGADNSNLTGNTANNVLTGNSGNNVLDGGSGNDTLAGGAGSDTLKGGLGADTADYSAATSSVSASLNTGKASGGQGTDILSAIENLLGGAGSDALSGNTGANSLGGGAGNDILNGGGGDDSLAGNGGADTLKGGDGTDKLAGGGGKDNLTGGTGADRYVYSAATDTGNTATTRDVIADFSKADGDKLDLSAWDAKPSVAGVQHWSFVASFSGQAGQIRFDASTHLALLDQDGDKLADFQIELTGVASLASGDLILA